MPGYKHINTLIYLITGAHSVGDGYNLIRLGMADVMLAGSAEACLHPLAMSGFSQVINELNYSNHGS